MKSTLELNEILEAKLNRLAECEGLVGTLEDYVVTLLEEVIDHSLQDYPDEEDFENWLIENAA